MRSDSHHVAIRDFSLFTSRSTCIGEKKKEEAGISAIQSIYLALIVSVPFTIAGIFFSQELLGLMGGDVWMGAVRQSLNSAD